MKKLMTLLAAGLMTAAVLANPVRADDDDDPKPPPKPAPKATTPALTDESLGVLLERLGYETKPEKTSSGINYLVEFEQDGWTFRHSVSLSPNKKFLWITTSVCTLSPGTKPSAEAWQKLLEENDRIGPTTILFDKQNNQVRVAVALCNRGITAALLREQLSAFTIHVQSTSKLCDAFRAPAKQKPPVDDDDK